MPRYFFHSDDGDIGVDRTGLELPDLAAARVQATIYLGDLLRHEPKRIWALDQWSVWVMDGAGRRLFAVLARTIEPVEAALANDPRWPGEQG